MKRVGRFGIVGRVGCPSVFEEMGANLKNQLFLQIAPLNFLNKTTITEQTNLLSVGRHEM